MARVFPGHFATAIERRAHKSVSLIATRIVYEDNADSTALQPEKMSRSFLVFLLIYVCAMNEFGAALAEDTCIANSDCKNATFSVCCRGYDSDSHRRCHHDSCVGRYCSTDGDCGGAGECCQSNKCVTNGCSECYWDSSCSSGEYCCKLRFISEHNVCRRNCIGQTCRSDDDCGGRDEECDSDKKCAKSSSSSDSWLGTALSIGLSVAFVVGGIYCYRRVKARLTRRTVVVAPEPQVIAIQRTEVRITKVRAATSY